MPKAARVTNTANDPLNHIGTIILGSINTFVEKQQAALVGSTVLYPSHDGTIIQGSPNVFVINKPLARLRDNVSTPHGIGKIITASLTVNVNGA